MLVLQSASGTKDRKMGHTSANFRSKEPISKTNSGFHEGDVYVELLKTAHYAMEVKFCL